MWGERLGLAGLVEAAWDPAKARGEIVTWHVEAQGMGREEAGRCADAFQQLAELVLRGCRGGQFAWAEETAGLANLEVDPDWEERLLRLDECPAWVEFSRAVDLAARIDSFLAVLEREGTTRHLARDCRDDLDVLLVLADWCQDNGLPQAAAEARHLHGLAAIGRSW
jgi:hypothetical protein